MEKISSIVLCAGEGTRAKNISETIPKPLIKVASLGNQTILSIIISNLKKLKFDPIIVVTGHLSKQIEDYINSTQIKSAFGKKGILIHKSGLRYKLGPLFSFLSVTTNNQIYNEDQIYTIFPGDTVFDYELLREISVKLLEYYSHVTQYSIVFYRQIRTEVLLNQFENYYTNQDKTISYLKIDENGSEAYVKKIVQEKLSALPKDETINQVIPSFTFNTSYIDIIKDIATPGKFRSLREVVNLMIEKKKQFFAIALNPEYNFYDIDTNLDLNMLNEKKKRWTI
ncbi:MAG: NTP transferase domain-containing protein, partial [Candidatus Hermodarchaeota archaeon]